MYVYKFYTEIKNTLSILYLCNLFKNDKSKNKMKPKISKNIIALNSFISIFCSAVSFYKNMCKKEKNINFFKNIILFLVFYISTYCPNRYINKTYFIDNHFVVKFFSVVISKKKQKSKRINK